jgi:cation diffusion facilitator CzcD-associated flavoprotein CzcO
VHVQWQLGKGVAAVLTDLKFVLSSLKRPSSAARHTVSKIRSAGGMQELGHLFHPRTLVELPDGSYVVAEMAETRLPVISLETGQITRRLLEKPLTDNGLGPSALVLTDDATALIVVQERCLLKLKLPTGAKLATYYAPSESLFQGGDIVDGVLYVVDARKGGTCAFDPVSLKPIERPTCGTFHVRYHDPESYFPIDPPPPPEPADWIIEPHALRAHPQGLMIVDAGKRSILVFDTRDGSLVRTYGPFISPMDAIMIDGTLVVSDEGHIQLVNPVSGDFLGEKIGPLRPTIEEHPWPIFAKGICASAGGFTLTETLPMAKLHAFRLGSDGPIRGDPVGAPLTEPATTHYDCVVVGGGTVGSGSARDIAACGFKVLLVEADPVLGGVWARNKYPGLRLHAPGTSYRFLSLAPKWQANDLRQGEWDRMLYRPTQEEILEYIQSLAQHPNITVRTSTSLCYVEEGEGGHHHVVTSNGTFTTRTVFYATGCYEVTAGKAFTPFPTASVTNGALVVHSSQMSAHKAAWDAAPRKFLLGASKAAIDVLGTCDPDDTSIVWAHRGHIIFTNRANLVNATLEVPKMRKAEAKKARAAALSGTDTANKLLREQNYAAYNQLYISSGKGVSVGQPLSRSGTAQRGGIEDEAVIARCRQFAARQVILESARVVHGQLNLVDEKGQLTLVGANEVVVLCTGQRAEGFGPTYHRECAQINARGCFMPYAVSGSAANCATYWVSMCVNYLDGKRDAYSDGRLKDAALSVAKHMEGIPDKSPWACFMTYLAANQLDVAGLIFPWKAVGSGDMLASPRWLEWYGRDLDPRAAMKLLAKSDYDDKVEMSGVTLDDATSNADAGVAVEKTGGS